jgi:hypothetical protein
MATKHEFSLTPEGSSKINTDHNLYNKVHLRSSLPENYSLAGDPTRGRYPR